MAALKGALREHERSKGQHLKSVGSTAGAWGVLHWESTGGASESAEEAPGEEPLAALRTSIILAWLMMRTCTCISVY